MPPWRPTSGARCPQEVTTHSPPPIEHDPRLLSAKPKTCSPGGSRAPPATPPADGRKPATPRGGYTHRGNATCGGTEVSQAPRGIPPSRMRCVPQDRRSPVRLRPSRVLIQAEREAVKADRRSVGADIPARRLRNGRLRLTGQGRRGQNSQPAAVDRAASAGGRSV